MNGTAEMPEHKEHKVAIVQQAPARYPDIAPFHPPHLFPELGQFSGTDTSNQVYHSIRELFRLLDFDRERFNTPSWNPLGWIIKPGETVFVKPNMIAHKHEHSDEWEHVITHGSVIRPVVDYVYLALGGKGKIIIGDGCQSNSDFDKIVERMGLLHLQEYYRKELEFDIEIVDLRDYHWVEKDGVFVEQRMLAGDPRGKVAVDLGRHSMFHELDASGKRYYGATYDIDETNRHHSNGKHEYAISRSPLVADVFINIPKLKTHKKCGMTVNLKSLVGINANKNWLPHYVFGPPETGGDQFDRDRASARVENALVTKAKSLLLKRNPFFQTIARYGRKAAYRVFGETDAVVRSGNWFGNDTVWRMSLDLNRILMYCDADGVMGRTSKRYFSIVDGVIAMEGNGPVAGTRKPAGVLVAGRNPVAVDLVCATLMGFDYRKLRIISGAMKQHVFPLFKGTVNDITCVSNVEAWNKPVAIWEASNTLKFRPHFAWAGHIEWDD